VELNAGPAVLALVDGKPDSVFQVDVVDGHVQCVYIVRNPDKLTSLA
jgi:RNA polymerase sigma-70 factor (ECF subfamily)